MTEALNNHTQNSRPLNTTSSNISFSDPWAEPTFTTAAQIRVIVTFCFFLLSACCNAAVLCSIMRKRRKSHIRVLILSLTIADLLVTVIVMPLDAVWNITIQWYAGDVSCKILNFLKLFAMYASAFVLVVISLDRHAAILYPFSFTSASQRNNLMLCVAWTLSILLAAPQLFIFRLHTIQDASFTQCVTFGSFPHHWQEIVYNMFTFTTLYVTPLSVMIICYARILLEINRQVKDDKALARSKNDHISKARMKTLKMTIVIVASFIICWTPYYLLGLWYWFQPEMIQKMPEYINHSLFLFGLLHTCSDPIIYGLYTPSFREDMMTCFQGMKMEVVGSSERRKERSASMMNIRDYSLKKNTCCQVNVTVATSGTIAHTIF
ncbi:gonadotropin-releasing hormone II receptor-like isoform X2 [Protopterus annectens]|uniref:gonadotropin-releasing hormone II receptor-like isoform X2 n=1 Tax=Protopterus annectens TaxID=7888 RepID=UPI001CFBC400|nr:gonadotropin-releasing hormone II receptor-like isoform X2 [Protopterus annectens]